MILYKKDTKGKIRFLEIFPQHDTVVQISGLIGTSKKVTNVTQCHPKNVGRSNATSAEEQAVSECTSKINQKIDEGYFRTREEAEEEAVLLPMLAKEFNKEKHKIDWTYPVYVQPKLDGMRSLGIEDDVLLSRAGKEIDNVGHLHNQLKYIRQALGAVPDGELYAHGLSFQENMSLIKKYRQGKTEQIKMHVYDVVSDEPFHERFLKLRRVFSEALFTLIEPVPTWKVESEEDIIEWHRQFLVQGYEGTIIRHGKESYKINGRSSNLLKFKDFKDMTVEVVDVIPSDRRPEQGIIVCKGGFKASLKFSFEEREWILKNKQKYIGQKAEIRYFQETDEGLPRFPVCVGFRND